LKFSRMHYVRNLGYCIAKDAVMYGYHIVLLGHFVGLACVARIEQERDECRILMRKPTGEWSFKRSRIIWEDITNIKEIDWKDER